MKLSRRTLLEVFGVAPAAVAAPMLLSASTLGTHPVVSVPNLQCGRCGSGMAFEPLRNNDELKRLFRNREPVLSKCYGCGVIVAVPLSFVDCRVAARDSD